jgi:hypothetical protein
MITIFFKVILLNVSSVCPCYKYNVDLVSVTCLSFCYGLITFFFKNLGNLKFLAFNVRMVITIQFNPVENIKTRLS